MCGVVLAAQGCFGGERLLEPAALHSPYPLPRVWAVAPFANESGVSKVDTARIADAFTYEIEQVRGLQTVPVNRVLAGMKLLDIKDVSSEADAVALLNVLDVDGLIAGTVTAYDPYTPMKLGLAVQLFGRERSGAMGSIDPRALVKSSVGEPAVESVSRHTTAQASGIFDASNHAVRVRLHAYAKSRNQPGSAFGSRIYDVSMDLYAQFVSYRLISDLLEAEQGTAVRLAAQETSR